MNAKDKAKELVNKFSSLEKNDNDYDYDKLCALICVDEIIDNCPFKDYGMRFGSLPERLQAIEDFWQEVKTEIEKL